MLCLVSQTTSVSNSPAFNPYDVNLTGLPITSACPVHENKLPLDVQWHMYQQGTTGSLLMFSDLSSVCHMVHSALWWWLIISSQWEGEGARSLCFLSLENIEFVSLAGTFSGSPLYCGVFKAGGAVIIFFIFFLVCCIWVLVLVSLISGLNCVLCWVISNLIQSMPTECNVWLWMFIL